LGNFQQSSLSLVVNESATFDIGFGFVCDLHKELGSTFHHVLQDGCGVSKSKMSLSYKCK
jgi:fructose-1,6-bisphosphatase